MVSLKRLNRSKLKKRKRKEGIGMGDTNPWRDLGYTKWYDPYAVFEDPQSAAFRSAVADEGVRWSGQLSSKGRSIRSWEADYHLLDAALPKDPAYAHEIFDWQGHTIYVQHGHGHRLNVWIYSKGEGKGKGKGKKVTEYLGVSDFVVDPTSSSYCVIEDVGQGSETLQITVFEFPITPLWKHSPVGPNAAFHSGHILYQTVENRLRYPGIVARNLDNGRERTLLHISDKRFQVELLPRNQIFVRVYNALDQRIGYIEDLAVRWMAASHSTIVGITHDTYATDTHLHVGRRAYALPGHGHIVDAAVREDAIVLLTVRKARVSLITFQNSTFRTLYSSKVPNEVTLLHRSGATAFHLPHRPIQIRDADGRLRTFPEPVRLYLTQGMATSADGTRVPYTIVANTATPRRLLVSAYGAYGISASRSYPIHWLPWLQRGYALAIACPRGGRDDGDPWYDGGRLGRKQNTFDDTYAVICAAQATLRISPKQTIFHGRSAGGLLAANIAQQFPNAVGAVYAEVPYVDVLRTTTNPSLPLTQLEYDEFGDPAHRIEDYRTLQTISPVDTVPTLKGKGKGPVIVAKTALHDAQVYPYEVLKWARRLREQKWTVYVGIDKDGGHCMAESGMYHALASDAALLDGVTG